jgi:hypothetical protein
MKYFILLCPLFFLFPITTNALSCAEKEDNIWIAAYEEGKFVDGFVVEYLPTGNTCDERPVVLENEYMRETFNRLIEGAAVEPKTGVFQVSVKCLNENWADGCFPSGAIEQVFSDSQKLENKKLAWVQKEQNAKRISTTHMWFLSGLIVAVFGIVVFWPWIVMLRWSYLRKSITSLLIFAIPVQFSVTLFRPMFEWSYPIVNFLSVMATNILILIIVIEIVYLILRFIQLRKEGIASNKK